MKLFVSLRSACGHIDLMSFEKEEYEQIALMAYKKRVGSRTLKLYVNGGKHSMCDVCWEKWLEKERLYDQDQAQGSS